MIILDVSTGVAESMIYAGLTFHEQIMERETLMTFTAGKNLDALIQVSTVVNLIITLTCSLL